MFPVVLIFVWYNKPTISLQIELRLSCFRIKIGLFLLETRRKKISKFSKFSKLNKNCRKFSKLNKIFEMPKMPPPTSPPHPLTPSHTSSHTLFFFLLSLSSSSHLTTSSLHHLLPPSTESFFLHCFFVLFVFIPILQAYLNHWLKYLAYPWAAKKAN